MSLVKIKDLCGQVFLGGRAYGIAGKRYIKCNIQWRGATRVSNEAYAMCLENGICYSVPENCLNLEVEVIGTIAVVS